MNLSPGKRLSRSAMKLEFLKPCRPVKSMSPWPSHQKKKKKKGKKKKENSKNK